MEGEIMKTESQVPASITIEGQPMANIISQAIAKGANLPEVRELLNILKEGEAYEAKKCFHASMSKVCAAIPVVEKTEYNPITKSKFAPLVGIVTAIKPIYTAGGFSLSFNEGETSKPEHMRIIGILTHEKGHTENYFYDIPLDGKGLKGNSNMTAIQAKGSTVSYGRRYLICMIFNVPTGDDVDGNLPNGIIDEKELSNIRDQIAELGASENTICSHLQIDDLEKLPKKDYQKVLSALEYRRKNKGGKA